MVEVLVEYDYIAQEPDELTIKKGDIIREVVKKPGGWWEGVLNEKRGMFPDNFVRLIDKDASVSYRTRKDPLKIRQCRVVFSYKQDHPDELNLNIGDIINILGEEEEGWWRGTLNGIEGVFPSNFVEEIKSKPGSREDLTNINENSIKSPLLPPKPIKIQCQVKYSYKAQNDDELTLNIGDLINLISREGQDPGWWKGELNGQIGVFPDNFVAILSEIDDKTFKTQEPLNAKQVTSAQRKSVEDKQGKLETDSTIRITPPVPSKKPIILLKKSPTSSNAQNNKLLAGLRKKIVDVVDGASSSKTQITLIKATEIKEDTKTEVVSENAFDQVERTSMLSDVRATRAKAPGRRPPSVIFKDGEPGIVNGNTEHAAIDNLADHFSSSRSDISNDQLETEVKPKMREWEKHKAPWLEEMKLNQAKRTSTSPGPEQSRLKLTPSDKSTSPEIDESKFSKVSPLERPSPSPVDMSKSMSSISNKLKTPPNELEKNPVVLRNKPVQPIPQTTIRPQSIHSVAVTNLSEIHTQKQFSTSHSTTTTTTKISPTPIQNNKASSNQKPQIAEKALDLKACGEVITENISYKQYLELIQRIEKLEVLVQQQHQIHKAAIEELKGKLQVETDMRRLLQAELDKVSHCVMQV